MDEDNLVLSEMRGGVLLLTLNRPERLNAWSDALERRYFALLARAEADPEVRAVVVTGAGRGFCSGADLNDLAAVGDSDHEAIVRRDPPRQHPLSFRKPLIAAINGAAAGLGLVEALYCDLRFAVPDAKLTAAFSRRGLIAEHGVVWLLVRLVGRARAFDILASSRVILGDEALQLGLVDHVVEPEGLVDAAVAYALDLSENCSPAAMRAIKEQILQAEESSFAEAVADANRRMLHSFVHPDFEEGVNSFRERRAPRFEGLALRGAAGRATDRM